MGWLQGTVVLGGGGSLGARAHTITAPMTVQITTLAPRDTPPNFLSLALLARSSQ